MQRGLFQQQITSGRFTFPLALLCLIAGWIVSLYHPAVIRVATMSPFWAAADPEIPKEPHLLLGINLVLYLLIGFLLIPFNKLIAVIRIRASIQTALFFLWSALLPFLHPLQGGSFTVLLLLASLFCLVISYQHPRPMARIYHAWLLLGFASLITPEVLGFIPAFLIGSYLFKSFSLKSFLAGILGLAFAYLIYGVGCWANGRDDLLTQQFNYFSQIETNYVIPVHPNWMWALILFHGLLFVVAALFYWIKSVQTNIKTRDHINFLLTMELFVQLIIYLKPDIICALLPLSLIILSLIEGHYFTTIQTKATNVFFISIIVFSFLLHLLILWKI